MAMPIDLVLVRHGQSEGNVAKKLSEQGDHSAFQNPKFAARPSSLWRLTDVGRSQAVAAGQWIRDNISGPFDRRYVSEFVRAQETAALLGIEGPPWYRELYLRERNWGDMDVISEDDRRLLFAASLGRKDVDPLLWRPPNGESLADLCLRTDRMLDTLHRENNGSKVIIVNHGESMWSFRIRLERISMERYLELDRSAYPQDHIHNCQILHYSRRNPETGVIEPYLNWFRSVCPTNLALSSNVWVKIERSTYTNRQLLDEVEKTPRLINS